MDKKLSVYIVAHPDDWQLFIGEKAYDRLLTERNVFIYLSSGDSGKREPYWKAREEAAVASITQVFGGSITRRGLAPAGFFQVYHVGTGKDLSYFLRLPDGFHQGQGSPMYEHDSLLKLWKGELGSIRTVDKRQTFSKATLLNAVWDIIASNLHGNEWVTIHTLDTQGMDFSLLPNGSPHTHSDHYVVSLVATEMAKKFRKNCSGMIYGDYHISKLPQNLKKPERAKKGMIFQAYDKMMAELVGEHRWTDARYQAWLTRSYPTERSCEELTSLKY